MSHICRENKHCYPESGSVERRTNGDEGRGIHTHTYTYTYTRIHIQRELRESEHQSPAGSRVQDIAVPQSSVHHPMPPHPAHHKPPHLIPST